jgi:hypothetical protein
MAILAVAAGGLADRASQAIQYQGQNFSAMIHPFLVNGREKFIAIFRRSCMIKLDWFKRRHPPG